jgi:hypothetical protein
VRESLPAEEETSNTPLDEIESAFAQLYECGNLEAHQDVSQRMEYPSHMLTRICAALLPFAGLLYLSHARPDYLGAKGTKARLVFSQNVVE